MIQTMPCLPSPRPPRSPVTLLSRQPPTQPPNSSHVTLSITRSPMTVPSLLNLIKIRSPLAERGRQCNPRRVRPFDCPPVRVQPLIIAPFPFLYSLSIFIFTFDLSHCQSFRLSAGQSFELPMRLSLRLTIILSSRLSRRQLSFLLHLYRIFCSTQSTYSINSFSISTSVFSLE